jgi:hypothetical protein
MEIGLNLLKLHKEELKILAYLLNNKSKDISLTRLYRKSRLCKKDLKKGLAFLLDKQYISISDEGYGYDETKVRILNIQMENCFSINPGLINRLDSSTFKVYCVLQYLRANMGKGRKFTKYELKRFSKVKRYAFDKACRYLAKRKIISLDEYLLYASKFERSFTNSGKLKDFGFTKKLEKSKNENKV